jgi:hypothetical protein
MPIRNLEPAEAEKIVRHRRCSDCWEVLVAYNDPGSRTISVSCSTPGCPCRGHVSIEFVENSLAESRAKRWEAEHALGESGAVEWIPKPVRRAVDAVLSELGY